VSGATGRSAEVQRAKGGVVRTAELYDASKIRAIVATCLPHFASFAVKSRSSWFFQKVIPCTPAILGGFPFASDQARLLQTLKGDKQRTRIGVENALFSSEYKGFSRHFVAPDHVLYRRR
jgi:hypothetical protein